MRQVVIQQREAISSEERTVRRDILDDVMKWMKDDRILVLTGLRRSGKSTLLRQMMAECEGYGYVNFEDERFLGFEAGDFENLNEVIVEAYGEAETLFFDEIQNIKGFELFVRRLQDQGRKLVITGSNASLLSSELGTHLTGRYRAFVVYPFSFTEFLDMEGITWDSDSYYLTAKKVELLNAFREYLVTGGLPEYLKNRDTEYVKTLYDNIIYRDIITRYAIRKHRTVKELVNILATNVTCRFTYNSLRKDLGLANAITVKEYISYLANSYLFFELQRYDHSLRKQLANPKKIYLVDAAFKQITGFSFTEEHGKMLENFVFLELKRMNLEIYYYSGKLECDFVVKEGRKITSAIQVCHALNDGNREREVDGLVDCVKAFGLKEGLILTLEDEGEVERDGINIRVMPAIRWAMGRAV